MTAPADGTGDDGISDEQVTGPVRRSVLRNVSALLGAQAVTWTLSTVVMVIVPRRVGPLDQGSYRVATSIWAIGATAISLGTGTLLTLQVARSQREGVVRVGPTILARNIAYAVSWIPILLFVYIAGYSSQVVVLVVIAGAATYLLTIGDVASAGLAGLERLDSVAAADVFTKFVLAGVTVLVVIVTDDIRLIAGATVVSAAAYSGYLFRSLRRQVRIDTTRSFRSAADTARRSTPYLMIGVTRVLYNQVDVIVISLIASEVEVGWYGTADSVFSTLLFVPSILMTSLFPVLARTHDEDPEVTKGLLVRSFNGLLLIAVPIGLGIMIVADQFSVLLFGDRYDGAGPVLAVMGVVLIFTFVNILLGSHAVAIGRQRFWNVLMVVAIPMTILLDLVLVPWTREVYDNGAIGGALAYVVTESMMAAVGIWGIARHLLTRAVLERVVKSLVAGAAMVAACWPLRDEHIAITVAVGAVVFVVVFGLLRPLDDDEKDMVRRLRRRLPFGHGAQ